MNNIDLELSEWGDGTTRLSFWDSLHGRDKHFVLREDGRVFEAQPNGPDDEIMVLTSLVESLLKLLKDVEAARALEDVQ